MGNDIKEIALQKALGMLRASGVDYVVRMPDGTTSGNLKIAEEPPPKAAIRRRKMHNWLAIFPGYGDKIAGMKPGELLEWECETTELADCFRAAATAAASQKLPKGCYMSTLAGEGGRTVQILRVD